MKKRNSHIKFFTPILYSAIILLMVVYVLNEQNITGSDKNSPLFQNLMENPAFIRKGFDVNEILSVPEPDGTQWVRFYSPPLRIKNSLLPDLPKRKFLSPKGSPEQEFTIIIPIEMSQEALLVMPGMYLGYIGENWEIFLNGALVQSEMHLDESGKIKSRRNWRGVSFPIETTLFNQGTNIIAFRIVGDPALGVTGFYYTAPYYLEDYDTINKRQQNYLLMFLCGIFCFTGIYYLMLYIYVRKKEELFNLYYGIFSLLLCIYTFTGRSVVNNVIPNSDISIRLEFASLFMMVSVLCLFIEQIGRQRITKVSFGFFIFSLVLSITQAIFCTQYGAEVLTIWSVLVLVYLSYVFFYDIIYFYFWEQRKKGMNKRGSDTFITILIGSVLVYACGLFDLLDVIVFHKSIRLFLYSTFVFHIGMAFTLSKRFSNIFNRLEHTNIILAELKDALLKTMAEMVEQRDDITGGHIERTQHGVKIFLDQLEEKNLYEEERKELNKKLMLQSCQLHDVGKISISDSILKKPGKLNDEEFEEMKKHTLIGEKIIERIETLTTQSYFLKYAKIFAACHHEKWNGTGYPRGLKENDIPLIGRIMAIVDVYDALTSERPYKPAFTHDEAVEIIVKGSGTQFDPALVELFMQISDQFKALRGGSVTAQV
ncbi:MAG: HD domain-containing protein [Treponema sp.]|nr:HD domain-containing protein [Treponema sp.]